MKTKIAVIVILVVLAALGAWVLIQRCGSERAYMVRAWQLTPEETYDGQSIWDPVISWSPNSKSLLLAVSDQQYKQLIMRWDAGGDRLRKVTTGVSPNYIDNDHFLFMLTNPGRIMERTLSSGTERPIVTDIKNLEFWKDMSAFSYVPEHKTLALRFSAFTRYYEPGCEEIDLKGKFLGMIPRTTGNGILDRSDDPSQKKTAEILGELTSGDQTLKIAGKRIATGDFGAVAWSPDGKTIAYGEKNAVKIIGPDGQNPLTVARFGSLPITGDAPFVCRLVWSPDSRYLAAVELVPNDTSGHVMIYVLDMSLPAAARRG